MRLHISGFAVVCLFFIAAFDLFGQADRGTITGILSDQGGSVIANATVQAKNSETGQVYSADTTGTGNYTIAQLPYGNYEVSVEVAGFKRYVNANMLGEVE